MRRQFAVAMLRLNNPGLWSQYRLASRSQWQAEADHERLHDRRLAALLRHVVTEVPRYREWAREAGLGAEQVGSSDLNRFPTVDKRALMADKNAYVAEGALASDRIASHTGGSSGVIFHFEYDGRSRDARRAGDLLGRTWAGWRPGDAVAYVWGHTGDVSLASGLRARAADALMHRRTVLNAFDMDEAAISAYAAKLRRERPALIIGYASSLAFLAEYMARKGLDGVRPKGVISSAESLGPEKRAVIAAQFQCPVLDRYGSREFANIAQQCEKSDGLHVFHERLHVEVLRPDGTPCAPGELGEITITDLENRVMPFVRYRTGDLAVTSDRPCTCGRAMPVLASVHGRTSEIIVGPNGKYYACPGPTWLGVDIPGIGQLQLIQPELHEVEVRIVPGPGWTDASRRRIEERMRLLLGDVRVTVNLVERIPPAPSGKHQIVISRVSPFSGGAGATAGTDAN